MFIIFAILIFIRSNVSLDILTGPYIAEDKDNINTSYFLFEHLNLVIETRVKTLLKCYYEVLLEKIIYYDTFIINEPIFLHILYKIDGFRCFFATEKFVFLRSENEFYTKIKIQKIPHNFNKHFQEITILVLLNIIDFVFMFKCNRESKIFEKEFGMSHDFWSDFLVFFSSSYNFIKSYNTIKRKYHYLRINDKKHILNLLKHNQYVKEIYFLSLETLILKFFESYYLCKKNEFLYEIYNYKCKCLTSLMSKNYKIQNQFNINDQLDTRNFYLVDKEKNKVCLHDFRVPYFSVDSIFLLLCSILNEFPIRNGDSIESKIKVKLYINLNNNKQFYDYIDDLLDDISKKNNINFLFGDIDYFLMKMKNLLINRNFDDSMLGIFSKEYNKNQFFNSIKNNVDIHFHFFYDNSVLNKSYFKNLLMNNNIFKYTTNAKLICDLICDSLVLYRKIFAEHIYRFTNKKKIDTFVFEESFFVNSSYTKNTTNYRYTESNNDFDMSELEFLNKILKKQADNIILIKNFVLECLYKSIGNEFYCDAKTFCQSFDFNTKNKWRFDCYYKTILSINDFNQYFNKINLTTFV
ncbi:hypothetical protein GVAV_001168 [Gurleya vavrai]